MIHLKNRILYKIRIMLAKLSTTSYKILPYNIKLFIINIITSTVFIKLYIIRIYKEKIYIIFYLSLFVIYIFL